jgi:hypothetical protein
MCAVYTRPCTVHTTATILDSGLVVERVRRNGTEETFTNVFFLPILSCGGFYGETLLDCIVYSLHREPLYTRSHIGTDSLPQSLSADIPGGTGRTSRDRAEASTAAGSGSKTAATGASAAADGPPTGATNGKLEGAAAAMCMPPAATQSVAVRVEDRP